MRSGLFFLFSGVLFVMACNQQAPSTAVLTGWELTGFTKVDSLNPILVPDSFASFSCPIRQKEVLWSKRNVLNPAAVVKGNQVYLFFRAQDAAGTSRIGMAVSSDGLHFKRLAEPIFYPAQDEWKALEWNSAKKEEGTWFDGVEDPRIIERLDGGYLMTYTAYDGKTARLCSASSTDLVHWVKHGPVLRAEKYKDKWSKSGAVIGRQEGSRIVAAQINGRYWMYFGDTDLFMASSVDLVHWEPLENAENNELIRVLTPRPGYFDSRLVEPGPFALWTEEGVLLIYNASNAANYKEDQLPKFTYAAGQALFDTLAPWKLTDRSTTWFIHPDKPYERVGEVNEVCFVEGLVYFKSKWLLYYGTADSRIAVAVKE